MSLSPFSQLAHWLRRLEVDGRNDDPKQRGVEGTHRESTEIKLDAGGIIDQERESWSGLFSSSSHFLTQQGTHFYTLYNWNN